MPITQVLLTSTAAPPPPPLPTPDGIYVYNGINLNWGAVGVEYNKPAYNASFSYPGATDPMWDLNGLNQWMTTQPAGAITEMYMNLWFYPRSVGVQVMTVQNSYTENSAYTHSALEIRSDGTMSAGLWNGASVTAVTSTEQVVMNSWNHVYLSHNGTTMTFRLNNGTAYTANFSWGYPNNNILGFGTFSNTRINQSSNRFDGRIGELRWNSAATGSNYDATKSKYQYAPAVFLDANNTNSYPGPTVISNPPSFGYGNANACFVPGDFTQGSITQVQVGWTVTSSPNNVTRTVTQLGIFGSGWITLDGNWDTGAATFTYAPPTTWWSDLSGNNRYARLYNTPAFNNAGTKYFDFVPASLQWAKINPIGDLNRWTVETWINTTAGLNTTQATAVVTTVFNDEDPGGQGSIGAINYAISNNFVSPGYTGLKAGFFNGAWNETSAVVPSIGDWIHLVGTYDGRILRYYLNGSNAGTQLIATTPSANGGAIRIARRWDGPLNQVHLFPGKIGLIRIYPEARSETEVAASYNATKAIYGL